MAQNYYVDKSIRVESSKEATVWDKGPVIVVGAIGLVGMAIESLLNRFK